MEIVQVGQTQMEAELKWVMSPYEGSPDEDGYIEDTSWRYSKHKGGKGDV